MSAQWLGHCEAKASSASISVYYICNLTGQCRLFMRSQYAQSSLFPCATLRPLTCLIDLLTGKEVGIKERRKKGMREEGGKGGGREGNEGKGHCALCTREIGIHATQCALQYKMWQLTVPALPLELPVAMACSRLRLNLFVSFVYMFTDVVTFHIPLPVRNLTISSQSFSELSGPNWMQRSWTIVAFFNT